VEAEKNKAAAYRARTDAGEKTPQRAKEKKERVITRKTRGGLSREKNNTEEEPFISTCYGESLPQYTFGRGVSHCIGASGVLGPRKRVCEKGKKFSLKQLKEGKKPEAKS